MFSDRSHISAAPNTWKFKVFQLGGCFSSRVWTRQFLNTDWIIYVSLFVCCYLLLLLLLFFGGGPFLLVFKSFLTYLLETGTLFCPGHCLNEVIIAHMHAPCDKRTDVKPVLLKFCSSTICTFCCLCLPTVP